MFKILLYRFTNEKKGSIIPIFIATLLILCIFFFVFVDNFVRPNQVSEQERIVQMVAEIRAKEINNPLKEAFGVIEAMPSSQLGRTNYEAMYSYPEGYDYKVTDTNSPENVTYINRLDEKIKLLLVSEMELNFGDLVEITPEDVCVKTITLPPGIGQEMDVSCVMGGENYTYTMYVDGLNHPAHKGKEPRNPGDNRLQVTNAVFVATAFKLKATFRVDKVLDNITSLEDGFATVDTAAIAYPMLEQTTTR